MGALFCSALFGGEFLKFIFESFYGDFISAIIFLISNSISSSLVTPLPQSPSLPSYMQYLSLSPELNFILVF